MRNIAILFAILSISIPCAATTVTFTDAGSGVINWTSDGAGIVAMALDVDMTSGQIDTVTVDSFFDNVMVMAEKDAVRENRLALLFEVSSLFTDFADFSKISAEQPSVVSKS